MIRLTPSAGAHPAVVVRPSGRLDAHAAPALRKALDAALAASDGWVLVDLGDVHFLDARALGVLVATHHRCAARGGHLGLCSLQDPARIVLEFTGRDATLHVYRSRGAALEAMDGAAPASADAMLQSG